MSSPSDNDWSCSIKSNPDIGGIGIIASAFVQAGITISTVCYTNYLTRRPGRIRNLLWVVLHRIFSEIWLPIEHCPSVRDTVFEFIEGPAPVPNRKLSSSDADRILKITELQGLILNLNDMHAFAGISFLIAAITQTLRQPGMDLYHMLLAHQLTLITFYSHIMASAYVYSSREPHIGGRSAVYIAFLLLFLVFEVLYLWRLEATMHDEHISWCLSRLAHPGVKFWATETVGTAGNLGFYQITLLYKNRQGAGGGVSNNAGNTCNCGRQAPPETPAEHPPERAATQIGYDERRERFQKLSNGRVALYLVRNFIEPKGIVTAVVPIFYCAQAIAVAVARESHRESLESKDDEDKWGFGQIAAIMVLAGVVFQFSRAYKGLFPRRLIP